MFGDGRLSRRALRLRYRARKTGNQRENGERAQADREIAPYRSKMTSPQIEQLVKQFTNKRLFETAKIARLSLFYM